MKQTVTIQERSYKRKLDPKASFMLVGNAIDGTLNLGIIKYNDFEQLRKRLFIDLSSIEATGEWDVKLYQVQPNTRLHNRWGYYHYPKPAKQILKYSYMNSDLVGMTVEFNEIIMVFKEYVHHSERDDKFAPLHLEKIQLM